MRLVGAARVLDTLAGGGGAILLHQLQVELVGQLQRGAGYPACEPACSMLAGSTPSPSIASASLTKVPITREVKKPRLSLTTIGVLPMASV